MIIKEGSFIPLLVIIIVFSFIPAYGNARVASSSIVVWSGTVNINTHIIIDDDKTLVIEDGTEILLGPDGNITVYGDLIAKGGDNGIVFRPSGERWHALVVIGPSRVVLDNVSFEGGISNLWLVNTVAFVNNTSSFRSERPAFTIINSTVYGKNISIGPSGGIGLGMTSSTLHVRDLTIQGCGYYGIYEISSSLFGDNITIENNRQGGVKLESSLFSVNNCTLQDSYGPGIEAMESRVFLRNSTVRKSYLCGIMGQNTVINLFSSNMNDNRYSAIVSVGGQVSVNSSVIENNTAYGIEVYRVNILDDYNFPWNYRAMRSESMPQWLHLESDTYLFIKDSKLGSNELGSLYAYGGNITVIYSELNSIIFELGIHMAIYDSHIELLRDFGPPVDMQNTTAGVVDSHMATIDMENSIFENLISEDSRITVIHGVVKNGTVINGIIRVYNSSVNLELRGTLVSSNSSGSVFLGDGGRITGDFHGSISGNGGRSENTLANSSMAILGYTLSMLALFSVMATILINRTSNKGFK